MVPPQASTYPDAVIYGGSNKVPALTKLVKDKDEFTIGNDVHVRCVPLGTKAPHQSALRLTHPAGVLRRLATQRIPFLTILLTSPTIHTREVSSPATPSS